WQAISAWLPALAKPPDLDFWSTATCCGTGAASSLRPTARTPAPSRRTLGIDQFSLRCATPRWRLIDSRISGRTRACVQCARRSALWGQPEVFCSLRDLPVLTQAVRKRLVGGNRPGVRSRRLSELSLTRRQTAVGDLDCRDFDGANAPSCADCREERFYPNDIHDAREIVGEHVQGHFGRNLGQSLHQKVGCSHPHLDRAEWMLDRLATHTHRLRVPIATLPYSFEHMFVLPARDASLRSGRALRFERTARACRRPITVQRLAVFLVRIPIVQLLSRRAAIDILCRQVDEILLAEAAIRLRS